MELSQPEVKIINESIKFVNRWFWYKYVLVAALIPMIYLSVFLIFSDNHDGRLSSLLSVAIGLIIGYLARNWSEPKKETLLLKLVKTLKRS
ncbi:hypothetical protein [Colwellia hornerae]|uniref:Uncharacterized protein n=1 Tax=Colwellia hornerae TaxID=89402 RepID=A0A5C6Q1W5_9GAMM|nr:hypothetical protein [Colwellia hornerae]TWX45091.1 hypothetical protein ESZ28_18775 [Colwellia hornerae]TWX53302.1 hypothetical protein ESZ26_18825 [Colwellia hornerae]TWX62234.1 hypothetical protein ESZ27_18850 [Colwellia hornerae]